MVGGGRRWRLCVPYPLPSLRGAVASSRSIVDVVVAACGGRVCGPGGRSLAPPRPPWAAVAALLALGSPLVPALYFPNATHDATLRYATLLLVARCSSSPPAAARRSAAAARRRPPRLKGSSSSPARSTLSSAASRRALRFCVRLAAAGGGLRLAAPAPPTHIRKPAGQDTLLGHAGSSARRTGFRAGRLLPV